jgi:hypothetical protein
MQAHIVAIGIVNAPQTDGYIKIAEYTDGSEVEWGGWHGSFDEAVTAAEELVEQINYNRSETGQLEIVIGIEDWTETEA